MIDTKKQINRSLQLPLVEITYRVIGTWRAHTGLIKSMFLSKIGTAKHWLMRLWSFSTGSRLFPRPHSGPLSN